MEEKIFNECLKRMEILKLSKQCISAFKSGKIWESESLGALYEVNEEEQEIINNFEKEQRWRTDTFLFLNLSRKLSPSSLCGSVLGI